MSERYPGGIITKTPGTPTGPYQNGTAPGIWTLDQQLQFQQQGIWPTAGVLPNYIEDVFSTYLYTGNSANRTITNGIDLSTKGGAVFFGGRNIGTNKSVYDTARGATYDISTNLTNQQIARTTALTGFTTSGFTLGSDAVTEAVNLSGTNYASWTFRKQAKFFDVVTYTGDGTTNQTINHNLGSTPGFIITKRTDSTGNWAVWHTSFADTKTYAYLNTTAAATTVPSATAMTVNSTYFTVGSNQIFGNGSGWTYVAYLFASNAGGFGSAGTDNVITCGSFTTDGSGNATVTLGYEPQWVLVKRYDTTQSWYMMDVMRGMDVSGTGKALSPNTSAAEINFGNPSPTATGFQWVGGQASAPLIYIAIRRGPMQTPTTGTSVYGGFNTTAGATYSVGFVPDLAISPQLLGAGDNALAGTRLTGNTKYLVTSSAAAEVTNGGEWVWNGTTNTFVDQGTTFDWLFKRAPGFCDVVCYTSNYSGNPAVSHNLGVVPELLIFKDRDDARDWEVYAPSILGSTYTLYLNFDYAKANVGTATTLTSTTFQQQSVQYPTGKNYIAYLFATIAGVSKVGSYTGNGTTQTINCGFGAGGVRFVLIKRTDSTGGWYVYDTTRGMTTLVDPYILLNSTAAQVATLGSVTTVSTGFALNSSVLAAINVNAGTYIFLAIA